MSTVVYRDGVMAADTRAYSGGREPIGNKIKVHRHTDGTLVGVSTNKPGLAEAFVAWLFERSEDPEQRDITPTFNEQNFDALVVKPNGEAYLYCDNYHASGPLYAPYFAIGSGAPYALGALVAGATAEQAAKIAIQLDSWSGGYVFLLPHFDPAAANPETAPEQVNAA